MGAIMLRAGLGLDAVLGNDPAVARDQYYALKTARAGEWCRVMCTDRLLGLLAHTMADLGQATEHYEDSLNFCSKGFRPELAQN